LLQHSTTLAKNARENIHGDKTAHNPVLIAVVHTQKFTSGGSKQAKQSDMSLRFGVPPAENPPVILLSIFNHRVFPRHILKNPHTVDLPGGFFRVAGGISTRRLTQAKQIILSQSETSQNIDLSLVNIQCRVLGDNIEYWVTISSIG